MKNFVASWNDWATAKVFIRSENETLGILDSEALLHQSPLKSTPGVWRVKMYGYYFTK